MRFSLPGKYDIVRRCAGWPPYSGHTEDRVEGVIKQPVSMIVRSQQTGVNKRVPNPDGEHNFTFYGDACILAAFTVDCTPQRLLIPLTRSIRFCLQPPTAS